MIVDRAVFRAKFGQGDLVVDAFKRFGELFGAEYGLTPRILVDLTGTMFTVVIEFEYRDLAHLAEMRAAEQAQYGRPEFQEWFASWSHLVESGTYEVYQVVQ